MKYIILSDIHGNLEAFEAAVESFPEGDNKIISVGDVVGYGANPNECCEMLRSMCEVNVLGNHDAAAVDETDISFFNEYAKEAVLWTRDNITPSSVDYIKGLPLVREEDLFAVAHGTLHQPESFTYMFTGADAMHTFEILKTRICFVGHSHVPGAFALKDGKVFQIYGQTMKLEEQKYIVNVGSIGQPRDDDYRACYCIYDTEKDEIEFRRVPYDVDAARKKIIDAGLPEMLGDRLLKGR